MKRHDMYIDQSYKDFVKSVKKRIVSARISAARSVNRELILLYWDIGQNIVEQQTRHNWGDSVVEMLSRDLRSDFPGVRGFSARNLWDMKRFFAAYSDEEKLRQAVAELPLKKIFQQSISKIDSDFMRQVVAEIPWGHNLLILNKVKNPAARLFYLLAAARLGWSRNILLNQIKIDSFNRTLIDNKSNNFPEVLPSHLAEQAEELLKSTYNLEFLGIRKEIKELENLLIDHLREFILELGYGFCFIGQQYRLTAGAMDIS